MKFTFNKKRYKVIFSWKFPFVKFVRIISCVKPSGTVSINYNTTIGIEPINNPFYKRKLTK